MSEGKADERAVIGATAGTAARSADKRTWRSLEELARAPELEEVLHLEHPHLAAALDGVDRRMFLKLMGASLALAGVAGCTRQPEERIVPYVKSPTEIVPGEPLFFATAMPLGGFARGLLVESHTGRPTKVEGNPKHPASLGATDAFAQASVLGLYDPDRAQVVRTLGEIVPWSRCVEALSAVVEGAAARQGQGLRLLTGTVTSPTLAAQIRELLQRLPGARWHQWDPVGSDGARVAARVAYGRPLDTILRLERAQVILSLDADLLCTGPAAVRYARDFAAGRRLVDGSSAMSRLYVVESAPTATGARADERLALKPSEIADFARALAARLGAAVTAPAPMEKRQRWITAVAGDLQSHKGTSAVVVGAEQPAVVHLLAHAINARLGNLGATVAAIEPVAAEPMGQLASIRSLVDDMRAGQVEALILFDVNPVYDAPVDLDFAAALGSVPQSFAVNLYDDETAHRCRWHVPATHYLESWSDVRAYDGTASIVQPLIAPLYEGKTPHEVLNVLLGRPAQSGYETVRAYWKSRLRRGADFERSWEGWLNDGVIDGTAFPERRVALVPNWASSVASLPEAAAAQSGEVGTPSAASPDAIEVAIRPDTSVRGGELANNGWLQELPRPITKLTWDNAVLMGPALAERLGVANTDVVEVAAGGHSVTGPVWIEPGHADGAVTLHLGYGRRRAGRVGNDVGFDAYALRTTAHPNLIPGATLRATGDRHDLACTQLHHGLHGRPIIRSASLDEYRREPEFAAEMGETPPLDDTLYPNHVYNGHAWGMSIDTTACIGCNACVVACQAENNIAVVGKDQVMNGREMHWIRIDRYYSGEPEEPETHFQPMLCQHCERAPCEVVCPVNATVHDSEGLNVMVYNRCVGTRYCANNCPYKVRRFNFFLYSDWTTETLKMQRNPEVTVRSRGVMEKCTYCVQRIHHGRTQARKEDRQVRDGEVRTACQQVCPTSAIVFGDLNDPESRVAKLRKEPRNYSVLGELNTVPRTTYLAEVRNPNPELTPVSPASSAHAGAAPRRRDSRKV